VEPQLSQRNLHAQAQFPAPAVSSLLPKSEPPLRFSPGAVKRDLIPGLARLNESPRSAERLQREDARSWKEGLALVKTPGVVSAAVSNVREEEAFFLFESARTPQSRGARARPTARFPVLGATPAKI
jgi:hypothetical protein